MTIPKKAFVLAAGFGKRMRPLTDDCPKPLLEVAGKTLLDYALDALVAVGVEDVVVNTHYLGDMIAAHLGTRKDLQITISHEDGILDTGGGVQRQIEFFGHEPFYVLNADILWTDGSVPALQRLAESWRDDMDILLLMQAVDRIPGWGKGGDYYLEGNLSRPVFKTRADRTANHVFMGPRLVHPRLFDGVEPGKFSFLELFHRAEKNGRLFALSHDGEWYHVGTPDALDETNRIFSEAEQRVAV